MNFLGLSKLLPPLFYPLGFTCILLILSLVLWWKRPNWVVFPVSFALILLLLASNQWTSNLLVTSLEWQNIPADIPEAEAIIVLGGSTRSAVAPRPMVEIKEQGDRVLYAGKLYKDKKAPLIILSGGRIPWLSSENNSESSDMADLLKLMEIPSTAIIEEPDSQNTYENAVNVKKIINEKGIKKVILVTSALHMPRSLLIFQKQGIDVVPAPTDFLVSEAELYEIFLSPQSFMLSLIPDPEKLAETTRALKEYLGIFIYTLKGWA